MLFQKMTGSKLSRHFFPAKFYISKMAAKKTENTPDFDSNQSILTITLCYMTVLRSTNPLMIFLMTSQKYFPAKMTKIQNGGRNRWKYPWSSPGLIYLSIVCAFIWIRGRKIQWWLYLWRHINIFPPKWRKFKMAPTKNTRNVPLTYSVINKYVQLCVFEIETSFSDKCNNVAYVFYNSITCIKLKMAAQ